MPHGALSGGPGGVLGGSLGALGLVWGLRAGSGGFRGSFGVRVALHSLPTYDLAFVFSLGMSLA